MIKTGKDLFNHIIGELKADERRAERRYRDSIKIYLRNTSYEKFSEVISKCDPTLAEIFMKRDIKSINDLLDREDITLDEVTALCDNRSWRLTFNRFARPKEKDLKTAVKLTFLRRAYKGYLAKKLCREVIALSIKAGKDTAKPTSEIEAQIFNADPSIKLIDFCDYVVKNGLDLKLIKPYVSIGEKQWQKYKQGRLIAGAGKYLGR